MRSPKSILSIMIVLLSLLPALSMDQIAPAASATVGLPPTITRTVNSFEGATVDDVTDWGSWSSAHSDTGGGASSDVGISTTQFYHALQSAYLDATNPAISSRFAIASLTFDSNSSRGTNAWDTITIHWKATITGAGIGTCKLYQMDGAAILITQTIVLATEAAWQTITLTPTWDLAADHFHLEFTATSPDTDGVAGSSEIWVDYLTITSGIVDVRVRFWNSYSGFGYYGEKLRARYYDFDSLSWVDIWQNEFQSYPFESELITVTDIFNRNVWTGYIEVDNNPDYIDILVPILTVVIQKPEQWDDSLPWEWQVTCLPNGPNAPAGVSLAAIGFEFEVLAGWYSFEWYQTNIYKAGNLTLFVDGNITQHSSHMLTNVTLQLKPDYERTDQGQVLNASNPADWIPILVALFEEPTVRLFTYAIGTIFAVSAFLGWIINRVLKDRRDRALRSQETTVRLEAKLDQISEKLEEDEDEQH